MMSQFERKGYLENNNYSPEAYKIVILDGIAIAEVMRLENGVLKLFTMQRRGYQSLESFVSDATTAFNRDVITFYSGIGSSYTPHLDHVDPSKMAIAFWTQDAGLVVVFSMPDGSR